MHCATRLRSASCESSTGRWIERSEMVRQAKLGRANRMKGVCTAKNSRGQAPGRTSFLTRFSHVLRRYQPRGVGLSDEVSQWRCRRETIRLRQGYGGQERLRRSSDLTPADACAQTSSDFAPRSDLWSGHSFGFAVGESPLRSVAFAAHLSSMPSCTTTKPRPNASARSCAN